MISTAWEVFYSLKGDTRIYKTNKVYRGNKVTNQIAKQIASRPEVESVMTKAYAMSHWNGSVIFKGHKLLTNSVIITHI